MRNRFAALAAALCVLAPPALADDYPSKPVRLVVPSTPTSVTGAIGGIIAQQLTESLGQSVMVDNRRGANGAAGARIVAKAAPDGYTLLLVTASQAIHSALAPDANADLAKNFAPVSLVASIPLLLAVNPGVPAKDVKELVAIAAAKPGQVHFASSNTGSASHLAAEMLKAMAKVDIARAPYKSDSASLQDLVSGQAQMMFEDLPSLLPSVQSGKLRGLAVTSAQRSGAAPDVPTMV
ncbi:MAG: tripartite tricarboxylate transporter substrate binding protein, partial [Proteobacteria bacterium]|nr:tripartite tricarboxylate transporter substrate binding protein [Pseudomonadota bacterium]